MTRHALVTGASTGIGRATVRVLIGKGWRVFAGVRKPSDADSLRQEFGDKVVPEILDVTDASAIAAAAADIRAQLNGQTVLNAYWGPSVAKNPFLMFKIKGAKAGDKVTISWIDNHGDKRSDEAVVA